MADNGGLGPSGEGAMGDAETDVVPQPAPTLSAEPERRLSAIEWFHYPRAQRAWRHGEFRPSKGRVSAAEWKVLDRAQVLPQDVVERIEEQLRSGKIPTIDWSKEDEQWQRHHRMTSGKTSEWLSAIRKLLSGIVKRLRRSGLIN